VCLQALTAAKTIIDMLEGAVLGPEDGSVGLYPVEGDIYDQDWSHHQGLASDAGDIFKPHQVRAAAPSTSPSGGTPSRHQLQAAAAHTPSPAPGQHFQSPIPGGGHTIPGGGHTRDPSPVPSSSPALPAGLPRGPLSHQHVAAGNGALGSMTTAAGGGVLPEAAAAQGSHPARLSQQQAFTWRQLRASLASTKQLLQSTMAEPLPSEGSLTPVPGGHTPLATGHTSPVPGGHTSLHRGHTSAVPEEDNAAPAAILQLGYSASHPHPEGQCSGREACLLSNVSSRHSRLGFSSVNNLNSISHLLS
jgi:hypothetical protein